MKILHINSSARTEEGGSYTRLYGKKLIKTIEEKSSLTAKIFDRDIALCQQPSFIDKDWISGSQKTSDLTPEEKKSLEESDELIEEFRMIDTMVVGAPMYNYSFPACLKAYFDQLMRANKTLCWHGECPMKGKKAYLICARGGDQYEKGQANSTSNFQTDYLRLIFKSIGFTDDDIHFLFINGTMSTNVDTSHADEFLKNFNT